MTSPDLILPYAAQDTQLAEKYGDEISAITGVIALLDMVREAIASLLRRASDELHRTRTITAVNRYFEAVLATPNSSPADKLARLKVFSIEIINIVIAERPLIAAKAKAAEAAAIQTAPRRLADTNPELLVGLEPKRLVELEKIANDDDDQSVTQDAEQILQNRGDQFSGVNDPTAVQIVMPSTPVVCTTFADLFSEALCYRIERVTCFFQRFNSTITRELPRPFLLSPDFGARLSDIIRTVIAPQIRSQSRNIGIIENSRNWQNCTALDFWETVNANERFKTPLKASWEAFWQKCYQRPVTKPGVNGKTVLLADPILQQIRKKLAPVADEYRLPLIRNPEIDLLCALAFNFDLESMEQLWNRLRQLYEQELDTRVYQEKARDGALRDSFLNAFEKLPDQVGDFMVILAYYCFPNVGLFFLDRFTHNKGKTIGERRAKIPYLMDFLDNPEVERLKQEENARMQNAPSDGKKSW